MFEEGPVSWAILQEDPEAGSGMEFRLWDVLWNLMKSPVLFVADFHSSYCEDDIPNHDLSLSILVCVCVWGVLNLWVTTPLGVEQPFHRIA